MKKVSEKTLSDGKWLKLKEGVFLNEQGKEYKWEFVEVKNNVSAVIIVAKLIPSNRFVLTKQYRPPLLNWVIGFPAGLAKTDKIEEEALRELKEETGYTGRITEISLPLKVNAGIVDNTVRLIKADIDENLPVNKSVKQELEESEEIHTYLVELKDVKKFLAEQYKQGTDITAGLWNYFFGESAA
jgi:ADP-ribose pyrophosphatase